jgi:hypothetical protein
MARLRRLEQAGAVFTESLSSINSLRKRGFTISGNPTIADSPLGKCMSFDGTDDKAAIGKVSGTIKTVGCWVYLTSTSEEILDFDSGTTTLEASTGTLSVSNCADEVMYVNGSASATITAGTWNHVLFTTATGISITNLQVATDNTNFGQIKIRDLMMFNRALTTAEITALAQNNPFDYEKNVISEWDGATDVGYKNLGNHGTVVGATWNPSGGLNGRGAYEFDGVDDKINVPDSGTSSLDVTNGLSLFMWINPKQLKVGETTGIEKISTYQIGINSAGTMQGGLVTANKAWGWCGTTSIACITVNTWNFIGIVYNNITGYTYYHNGRNVGSGSDYTGDILKTDGALNIGLRFNNYFNGSIDKVMIFDRALTNLEVMDLYKKQKAGLR